MRCPFALGNLSLKLIAPFLIPLFYLVRHYFLKSFDNSFLNDKQENKKSCLMHTFMINIGYLFAGLFVYIENQKTKSKSIIDKDEKLFQSFSDTGRRNEENPNNDLSQGYISQFDLQRTELKRDRKKKLTIYFLLLGVFNYFNWQIYDILNMQKFTSYESYYFYSLSVSFFFLVTAVASKLILKIRIYKHQTYSMALSFLLSLSIFFILLFKDQERDKNYSQIFLALLIFIPVRSLRFIVYVIGKKFMINLYISHSQIIFFNGIIGIIGNLLLSLLTYMIKFERNFIDHKKDDYFMNEENGKYRLINIFDVFANFSSNSIVYFIPSIIFWFLENYCIWLTISLLSPCHYIIYANIIMIVFSFCDGEGLFFLSGYGNFIYYIIFAFLGVIFSSLVFNEIIIIKLCGLDKNTSLEIYKRASLDIKQASQEAVSVGSLDEEMEMQRRRSFDEISGSSGSEPKRDNSIF